jgi:hypothetical protein
MKVALVLTGFMRNWKNNIDSVFSNIILPYCPDVYISSYSYSKMYWNSDPISVDLNEVIKTYDPKNYIFREKETCPKFNFKSNRKECIGREYSIRQLYGWYTNYLALNLFDFDNYDIIIKLRTDISIKNFKIISTKPLVIPDWKYYPGPCSPRESYVDYIAYGNSKYMKEYFNLYYKIQEMHDKNIADISLGETLLKEYLDYYVTKDVFLDKDTDWNIRGEMWASEKAVIFPL